MSQAAFINRFWIVAVYTLGVFRSVDPNQIAHIWIQLEIEITKTRLKPNNRNHSSIYWNKSSK